MTIAPGSRLGPYEIIAAIGAGGMGEVYRARDTRLDRTVAIKVLPQAVAQNAQLRLRFEREAKAISSLAHPNICTLHDVGSEGGVDFLVMEHLEGETLADRLTRGPVPVAEAVRIAVQIADALDKAHRRGIIHRDLKPGNIMLTRTGAKLLDFGLARSVETEAIAPDSPTVQAMTAAKPLTAEGMIVGTFQYMAPEQLEGRQADGRTDIFAFGAVLYEMLTGKRAFGGNSRASVIASILAVDPPSISAAQPLTPASLERVIRICLQKDPDERWQSAHDLRLQLDALASGAIEAQVPRRAKRTAWAGWIAAAVLAAGAIAFAIYDRGVNHQPAPAYRFRIPPQANGRFDTVDGPITVSPDGRHFVVAFGPGSGSGQQSLMLGGFDSLDMKRLAGADGSYDPFWSPDSRQIGFFNDGKLRRMDLAGSSIRTICSVGDARGATWSGETILVATGARGPIMRVPASGGTPQPVTKLDPARKETGHWRPSFLPDGRRFLYQVLSTVPENAGVFLGSLDTPATHRVLNVFAPAVYAEPGYLLYVEEGNLYAQRFDVGKEATAGEAFVIAQDVDFATQFMAPAFSASRNGVLAWHPRGNSPEGALSRISLRDGSALPMNVLGVNLDLAPNGTQIAMQRIDLNRNSDIWIHDLRRKISTRVTYDTANEIGPVWSPDSRKIAYEVITPSTGSLRIRPLSGPAEEIVTHDLGIEPVAWSKDGNTLLVELGSIASRLDLGAIDLRTRKMTMIAATPFEESSGRFSPDDKWVAYRSDESGQMEIYVQPFPPDGSKWQVTSGGGRAPRWSEDGKTLYYIDARSMIMSVPVKSGVAGFETGTPTAHGNAGSEDLVLHGDEMIVSRRDSATAEPIIVTTKWRP